MKRTMIQKSILVDTGTQFTRTYVDFWTMLRRVYPNVSVDLVRFIQL